MITTCAFPANIFNLMASEKVAPTAGLDSKDFSNATSRQDATSTDSSSNEERAADDLGSNGDHVFLDPKSQNTGAVYTRLRDTNAGTDSTLVRPGLRKKRRS
jgi:hypothetical protein